MAALVGSDCNVIIDNLLMNAIKRTVGICFFLLKNIISMHSDNKIVFSMLPALYY